MSPADAYLTINSYWGPHLKSVNDIRKTDMSLHHTTCNTTCPLHTLFR
jgi:hypothetical protein